MNATITALLATSFALAYVQGCAAPRPVAAATSGATAEPVGGSASAQQSERSAPDRTVESPFVKDVGAEPEPPPGTSPSAARRFGAKAPGAREFLVQPGQVWQHLVEDIRPGDEIVFPAGFHPPQTIVGLRGTRERPIVLRSRDRIAAAVGCGEVGWAFEGCSHVIVENILFINPSGAAIAVGGGRAPGDAGPATSDVTIRQCTIRVSRTEPGQDAIRIRSASDVIIDGVRVEGWTDSAVRIQDGRRVLVRGLVAIPNDAAPSSSGVRIEGGSSQVVITNAAFNRGTGTCIAVGTPGAGAPAAEDVTVERSIFDTCATALSIANARRVFFNRCTVVEPSEAVWAVDPAAATVEAVRIENTLVEWSPGRLRRFSPHPAGSSPAGITIGDILVHSAELPTAWEVIGRPFGVQAGSLTEDVDPKLDRASLRPTVPQAQRFGAYVPPAPLNRAAPAAP
jgi:hypothetical protein